MRASCRKELLLVPFACWSWAFCSQVLVGRLQHPPLNVVSAGSCDWGEAARSGMGTLCQLQLNHCSGKPELQRFLPVCVLCPGSQHCLLSYKELNQSAETIGLKMRLNSQDVPNPESHVGMPGGQEAQGA